MSTKKTVTFEDVMDTKAKVALGLSGAACMASLVQSWMQPPPPKGKRRKPPGLFWLGITGMLGTMGWLWWRKRKLQTAVDHAAAACQPPTASATAHATTVPPVDPQAVAAARRALLARLAGTASIQPRAQTVNQPPSPTPETVAADTSEVDEVNGDEPEVDAENGEAGMAAIIARLAPEEREKLDQVLAALSEESVAQIVERLGRLRDDVAVEFLRDLLQRNSRPARADAA